jgi:hypothetical protein
MVFLKKSKSAFKKSRKYIDNNEITWKESVSYRYRGLLKKNLYINVLRILR